MESAKSQALVAFLHVSWNGEIWDFETSTYCLLKEGK
jgi:hypothetical protein